MKFTCRKNELEKNLQTALLSLSPKTMLPYLSFLLMEAENEKVTITSTDLEVSTKITFNVSVQEAGKTLIHGDLFGALTRVQEDKDIIIEETGENIKIKCGEFHAFVAKGNIQDYPQIPEPPEQKKDQQIKIAAMTLSEMLRKTVFAASRDEVRYVLCSEYFEVSKGNLTVVATDGKRMSAVSREVKVNKSFKAKAIVPVKTINILQKILLNCEEKEEITIIIVSNSIYFLSKNVSMSSRLIDGTYPDFRNVIPGSSKIKAQIQRDELLRATVRASSLFQSGVTAQSTTIKYQLKKNKLTILADSSGFGKSEEEIEVELSGGSVNISFNPGYVIDVLKHLDDNKVVLELTDSLNAVVIKSPQDSDFTSLIMPMRA